MKFMEIAKRRYACRNYKSDKVEKEKLNIILEACRIAPTGANRQPHKLIIVQEDEGLKKLSQCGNFFHAPLAIIVCCQKDQSWVRPFDGKTLTDIDASIVTDHMMLQATELGLDSVWICYFKPDILKENFNIPEDYEPINILAIGYGTEEHPDPAFHLKARKQIDEIVCFEQFK